MMNQVEITLFHLENQKEEDFAQLYFLEIDVKEGVLAKELPL